MKQVKFKALKNTAVFILMITVLIITGSCKPADVTPDGTTDPSEEMTDTTDGLYGEGAAAPGGAPAGAQFEIELATSKGVTVIRRDLKRGDSGDEVRALQQKLADLGFLSSGGVSGEFDGDTYTALYEFELNNGLYADGKAGYSDLSALNQAN